MTSTWNPDSASEIKTEIEQFLRSAKQPLLLEDDAKLMDLAGAEWEVSFEFGRLLFQAWNAGHSIIRRIEQIAYREEGILALFVRRAGRRSAGVLELRETQGSVLTSRKDGRLTFCRELLALLQEHFPGWRLERVSCRSDREHSFSAWYARGLARLGREGWAFMGLSESEPLAAADAALAYGLNWLDWLRENLDGCVISGLKLFLPRAALQLTANRAAYLNPKALQIEIFEWPCGPGQPQPADIKDFGNVETYLTPRHSLAPWMERHRDFLLSIFDDALDRFECVPHASGWALSVRAQGLEIARLEGQVAPRLYWGTEGARRKYGEDCRKEFQEFIRGVLALRSAQSSDASHELYRLQPERWLESLVIRDVTLLDPALRADYVYPQVPAFSGADRGVVDILSARREGRLAVIELKLHEEMTLPLQGLDYWLRVKWLNERNQFREFGYFPGIELSQAPPLIYLVSPAFRFHSTNERIIRYLHPSVEIVQVGLNQQWRNGVKVLFRRPVHPQG